MKRVPIVFLIGLIPVIIYAGTNFPTSLDTFADKTASDVITSAGWNTMQDAIEALETKVGADGSADSTSIDYDLAAVETTLGTAVSDITALETTMGVVTTATVGYVQRSKFSYSDADTIIIGPGVYHHAGTVDQLVYWDSTLSFDSTDADTNWYYLYIDDSAIVISGTNVLTASELTSNTTAPSWSNAKHGWYNGNDRCIFAYYVVSGSINSFLHDGGDYIGHVLASDSDFKQTGNTSNGSAFNADAYIPGFSTLGKFEVRMYDSDDDYCLIGEERYILVYGGLGFRSCILDVHTTSAQKLYMESVGGLLGQNWTHWVRTLGWYIPTGM